MIYSLNGGIKVPPTSTTVPRPKNIWQNSAGSIIGAMEAMRCNLEEKLQNSRGVSRAQG